MQGDLIRRRRLELGLARRDVAREVGLSEGAVARVEQGHSADDWTLRQLRSLADALAMDVAELVSGSEADEVAADDVLVVGALLARRNRLTPTRTLAHATGWELDRVNRSLRALNDRAHSVGQRLQRLRGHVALRPAARPVDDEILAAMEKCEMGRTRLNATQITVLKQVKDGTLNEQHFSEADRLAYASLLNAGLVRESEGMPTLSEAADFSLSTWPADTTT